MPKILIIYSHPNPQRSRLNQALKNSAQAMDNVQIRDIYQLYPDFDIDIKAEQRALLQADIIVFQHPIYWYSCPALMKEWMDQVLQHGFAFGDGGTQLTGKRWLSAVSTGGDKTSYTASGSNFYEISQFLTPFERTACLCGMDYLPVFISHDALNLNEEIIQQQARYYVAELESLLVDAKTLENKNA